jgi:Cytochrome P460
VPGNLLNVDFMEKDSKRFADSGGWGYAVFDYDAASDTFKPGTSAGTPPQGNDAKCGFACHTRAKTRDYVFTEYGTRQTRHERTGRDPSATLLRTNSWCLATRLQLLLVNPLLCAARVGGFHRQRAALDGPDLGGLRHLAVHLQLGDDRELEAVPLGGRYRVVRARR